MRINNNLMAQNTARQLGIGESNTAKSMEKLSSGFRINKAGDDAAGLAISEKMRGQIRGLTQASRNAQDGISLVQTAEGALNETQSILQRMRELAVQSASDTNSANDRAEIQKEISQLSSEVNRISTSTEFNNKKILTGTLGVTVSDTTTLGNVDMGSDTKAATYTINTTGVVLATSREIDITAVADNLVDANGTLVINGTSIETKVGENVATLADRINSAKIGVTATFDSVTHVLNIKTDDVGADATLSISAGVQDIVLTASADDDSADAASITAGQNLQNFIATDITGGAVAVSSISIKDNTVTVNDGSAKGLTFTVKQDGGSDTITTGSALTLQIGANENQEMSLTINNMSSASLGVDAVDVTTQGGAKAAITTIQNAIDTVSGERSKLGATQNRLEHTIKNLDTSAENLQAAESRIRDVDMAKEMMEFTKNNILTQAAQAMLAQANSAPSGVLQLLK